MQTVIKDNLINYEVIGTKNRDSILLLHGWGRSIKDWEFIAKNLNGFKVVLMDLPGFGNSSVPIKPFDIYDFADVIIEFAKKLGLGDVILMGHSFGGKVSLIAASKDQMFKKLVLVDSAGIDEKNLSEKTKIIISKLIKPVIKLFPKRVRSYIFEGLASRDYINAGKMRGTFKKIIVQNVQNEAKKIQIPTLIIWGDKDKEVSTNSAKKFRSLIPNSSLRIIWGAGHDPFLEKPNKFLEILEEFLYE